MIPPATKNAVIRAEVAIIGGGIIGLLTAYELIQAGVQVVVIDRQAIAKESSWAGGGILSPLYPWRYPDPVTALASWSQQRYPELMRELAAETGLDAEYIKSGLLISSPNEIDLAVKWSELNRSCIELISSSAVSKLQPGVDPNGSSWLWMPEIAQVRNPKLLEAISRYLSLKDVKILENVPIADFSIKSGRVTSLQTEAGPVLADTFLLAAGAWSGQLLQQMGTDIDVQPVRGQMLLLRGKPGLLNKMVLRDSHYLIPRKDGRILVGSTLEYEGFDKSTTAGARAELVAAARTIFPGLMEQTEIETQWAGLRPGSPEGIPYIGQHPEIDNLYINSGHFRNGFVLGPASARLASDLMLDRSPVVDPGNYSLVR